MLAAGSGRRFGGPKQLVMVAGHTLVGHVVGTLLDAGLDVLVVVGPQADAVTDAATEAAGPGRRGRVSTVVATHHLRGMGASLAAAATTAGARPLVVALADQPGLRADDVATVVERLRQGVEAVRIQHPEGPGHPVGFGAAAHTALCGLAGSDHDDSQSGDADLTAGADGGGPNDGDPDGSPDGPRTGRDVLAQLRVEVVSVDHARPPDIDTPADLAAVAANWAGDRRS